ncbi:MAG TPA: sulfite exporter TauE/SafE family protein, partial [Gammaproteobacteria bacterium]
AIFFIDGGARITGYFISGIYTAQTLLTFALAVPLMLAALYMGGRVHTSITPRAFQRAIGVLLVGSGLMLLLR